MSKLTAATCFCQEIFQQFASGGGQQFHFQMGDGGAFEMGGGLGTFGRRGWEMSS